MAVTLNDVFIFKRTMHLFEKKYSSWKRETGRMYLKYNAYCGELVFFFENELKLFPKKNCTSSKQPLAYKWKHIYVFFLFKGCCIFVKKTALFWSFSYLQSITFWKRSTGSSLNRWKITYTSLDNCCAVQLKLQVLFIQH